MFAKVFTSAMKASLHRGDSGIEGLGDFRVTAALLHQSEQSPVLGPELLKRMPERIEFLGIDRAGRLGDIFVLFTERQKDAAQLLPAKLVDAGVTREPEEPRLKLRRSLQAVDRAHHLDEDLLREIFDVIAPVGHGENETRNTMLVGNNDLPLGVFVALLSPANKVGQRGR
jgi:hypothetical protein